MTKHHRITFLVGLLSFTLWAGQIHRQVDPVAAQGRTGLVLAHYYAWFDPSSFDAGKTPFSNPSPYFSTDAGTIQRHVSQAQSAGIDGFVQAWYGPDSSQQTEPNFATLLNVASGSGFKAAVSFEPISGFMPNNDARANALATLLAGHANHPAYLRMDGKPVIFFWANWALGVGEWEYIRNIADPNRTSIWIAEGGNMQYLSVFDGMYLYNIAWSPDPGGINLRWGGETRAASNTYGTYKYWAATAMPGFNDALLGRGDNTIVRDRGGGSYYQASFSGAAASSPDLLVITSFNEWPEGSHIEPSVEFGDFYLNLTRDLISTYKAGGIPAAAPVAPAPVTDSNGGDQAASAGDSAQQVGTPLPTNTPFPTNTPPATPTPLSDGRIVYNVQQGDTLISIAIAFDVTLDDLYSFNNLGPNSLLTIGQPITVAFDREIVAGTATAEALLAPTATATPSELSEYPNTTVRDEDGAIIYRVEEGNTLIEIALIYDLGLTEIYDLNNLTEDSLISVGQAIVVGYIPTPEADQIGGSADLPETAATETPTTTATPTATATPLPPTPTSLPTIISELPTSEPPDEVAANDEPQVVVQPAAPTDPEAAAGALSNWFLMIVVGSVVVLTLIGLTLLYISRRV